jgi:hypothetical protein
MTNSREILFPCAIELILMLLGASDIQAASRLSVTIEDESGIPVPVRVYLQNGKGAHLFPLNTIAYQRMNWNVSEEHFVPQKGPFSLGVNQPRHQGQECC